MNEACTFIFEKDFQEDRVVKKRLTFKILSRRFRCIDTGFKEKGGLVWTGLSESMMGIRKVKQLVIFWLSTQASPISLNSEYKEKIHKNEKNAYCIEQYQAG